MGPAADRWRAAADDPSRLWRRIERLKSIAKTLRSRLAQNKKIKEELAARDSKPVDNADAIRERLMQPFLGSEAEKLGATKYQLRDGETWEYLKRGVEYDFVDGSPCWFGDDTYRLAKGE